MAFKPAGAVAKVIVGKRFNNNNVGFQIEGGWIVF